MTHRDHDPDDAPVVPLRPAPAGGPPTRRAVIVSITDVAGSRVSTIRRGDGTGFTVSVPPGGVDAVPDVHAGSAPWIREHDGARPIPAAALDGLAARVGMHLVPVGPTGPAR